MKVWDPAEMTPAGGIWEDSRNAVNAGKRDVAAAAKARNVVVAAVVKMAVTVTAVRRRDAAAAVKRIVMIMTGAAVRNGKTILTAPA